MAFLGYCLTVTLRMKLASAAPGLTPREALASLGAIQMLDVAIPTTDGRELVLRRHTEQPCGYLDWHMRDIIKAAEVKQWDRLWQTLWSSCEKRWASIAPQLAVSRWIGHSLTVSGKHYGNGALPEEAWAAVIEGKKASPKTAQKTAQQVSREARTDQQQPQGQNSDQAKTPENSGVCQSLPMLADLTEVRVTGFEPATPSTPC